jgi:predicted aminopeptidase
MPAESTAPNVRPVRRGCVIGASVALVAIAASLLNPTVRYLVRAAWSEALILARRRPITAVIADPRTPPAVRSQLELVLAARAFAADSLGLRVKGSFTMYTKLDKDTLVLVLSGAYQDRLQPVTWWFPIVGEVPYKGYFDFKAAVRARDALRKQGFDAFLRPAPAFSTLGWFNDPVVSTSLGADSIELANTVIHELTHNTYYAADQAAFNESFADFVGARGAEQFFRSRGDTARAREAAARWADEKTLGAFWTWLYNQLDSAFRAYPADDSAGRATRLAARDTIFREARDSLTTDLPQRLHTVPPEALARARLDNAVLLARRVYLTDLDQFDDVYAAYGGDLRATVHEIIAIARANKPDPFGGLERWVAGHQGGSGTRRPGIGDRDR